MEMSLEAQKIMDLCGNVYGNTEGLANRIVSQALASENLWISHCLMDFFPSRDTRRKSQVRFFWEEFDGSYHDGILDLLRAGTDGRLGSKIASFELTCLAISHSSFAPFSPYAVERGVLLRFLARRKDLGAIYTGSIPDHIAKCREIFELDFQDAGETVGRFRCVLWYLTTCMRVDSASLVDIRSERVIESYPTMASRDCELPSRQRDSTLTTIDLGSFVSNTRLELHSSRKVSENVSGGRRLFVEKELRWIDQKFGVV